MCGRYATTRSADDLARLFAAFDETDGALAPDYNLAPTDPAPIVRVLQYGAASGVAAPPPGKPANVPDHPANKGACSPDDQSQTPAAVLQYGAASGVAAPPPGKPANVPPPGKPAAAVRVLSVARWGLLPVWADNPRVGARMINARSETVATAKAYAVPFKEKRCLVPADGWFEWATIDGRKHPHFMTLPEGFAFAGLWSAGRFGLSCSIITTPAVGDLTRIHDRMPLLLEPDRWTRWLTGPADEALLVPPRLDYVASIEIRPVGPAVGNVRNDGPELIARTGADDQQESLF